jgi:3-hydroxybutyryl-CoA dehydratase
MSGKSFAELEPGDSVRWRHEITAEEVDSFARLSGDVNPLHLDDAFGQRRGFRGRVVHGALLSAFISRVLGTKLPGPGCLWLSQTVRFAQPVYTAEPIEVVVRVVHKSESLRTLVLETTVVNARGETVATGEAKVAVPQPRRPERSDRSGQTTAITGYTDRSRGE